MIRGGGGVISLRSTDYIEPKVGIFSEAESLRKIFSTEGAIYADISQRRVLNISFIT